MYVNVMACSYNKSSQRLVYVSQLEYGLDPESGAGLFPKVNGDFLVCDKIFRKIRSLSP